LNVQSKKVVWISLLILILIAASGTTYVQHLSIKQQRKAVSLSIQKITATHDSNAQGISVQRLPQAAHVSVVKPAAKRSSKASSVTSSTGYITPTSPGLPALDALDRVTGQAASEQDQGQDYIPNGWGSHKNRIVRTSGGDLFTVFVGDGAASTDRTWHMMHQAPGSSSWVEMASGDAGQEPINILVGPHDELYIFTWPGTKGQLMEYESTDLGQHFISSQIDGTWDTSQGYTGSGINAVGDIVVVQTGHDVPGIFRWAYYSPASGKWSYHENTLDVRHTYTYVFPGYNNDLTLVAMRDALRSELGYPSVPNFNYIFNEISYYYIANVNQPVLQSVQVAEVPPGADNEVDITYLTDVYMDTQGRTHVLYTNYYAGETYHAIVDHGILIKNVPVTGIDSTHKARIIQDALGHFYILATSASGLSINLYPGIAQDTDGTQLQSPVSLDISKYPTCDDYDLCNNPTLTVPRAGDALSNTIDGVYGNYGAEIHFRINLRSNGS